MATFNLAAANAATDQVPVGNGVTFNISGTFVGTVQVQRATSRNGTFTPLAADNFGSLLSFTVPSGDLMVMPSPGEPDAVIRAVMTAYTSGTAVVRIGA